MKIEAKTRLNARRTQDWYSRLTADEKETYRLKYPGTKFHHSTKLIVPEKASKNA